MPFQAAGQFEFEQDRVDGSGRQPGLTDDLVDRDRRRAEQVENITALRLVRFGALRPERRRGLLNARRRR
jgi:hypothetical protein